jgi:hypothetical protein
MCGGEGLGVRPALRGPDLGPIWAGQATTVPSSTRCSAVLALALGAGC